MRGKFITLEGIDGAGKSTHVEWLADLLRKHDHRVRVTREPGGTQLGEKVRAIVLDPANAMDPESETLLMFAARREHIARVIEPTLKRGEWIVCDRFTDATFAYQGGGRDVAWQRLLELESWVHAGLQPDVTLLFDVTLEVGRERARGVRGADRFEQETEQFYERVRAAYLRRAQEAPARIRVVDGSGSIEEVRAQLIEVVQTICA